MKTLKEITILYYNNQLMSAKDGYTYENIVKYCEKYNCELLSDKNELGHKLEEFNIKSACGHECQTTFNRLFKNKKGVYCEDCEKSIKNEEMECVCFNCEKQFEPEENNIFYCSLSCGFECEGKRQPMTYELVKENYKKVGCELLNTITEYNKIRETTETKYLKFKIMPPCGHVMEAAPYYNTINKETTVTCQSCSLKRAGEIIKLNSKNENGELTSMLTEKNAVELLRELCKNDFTIFKTRECCKADILVKPNDIKNDSWLKIQLKSSNRHSKLQYGFDGTNGYDDMLLLLVGIQTKKFWLLEGKNVEVTRITIAKSESKYDKFEIGSNKICGELKKWYDKNVYNCKFNDGNTPQTDNCRLEYKYVMLRQNKIKFLNFINNEVDGLVYDFKIDNLKIQEKVCSIIKRRQKIYVCAFLGKSNGKGWSEKRRDKRAYDKGDNDYYWFNEQDEKTFYVVPESELIKSGHIATKKCQGKKNFNMTTTFGIVNKYMFSYDTIHEELQKQKLLAILNIH